ncbi:hypothetical protein J3Q64DRAFT_1759432 [Phycomyces blakesleeanus]|uniref:Tetraspanin n=2 Tax=Phycomyces blakesleeanus TaxID=4837 RepID=A0A167KEL7_PHYB8|nr:hypothetical protein PHYBLDRAFT_183416 [Phycomyces blakesleeanus NRRL 1555(-)]OAD67917.1 hypothetical protein PHYBLDRAFT_183416 [Phycomyces blakesleeanus NRRL 1555(-)]|eukprot:XP_018285957.1 hypothetical protein PHYBLDRAFT_183416 [Phycomyces blakesleeanus NRRL 1555(-)]
MGMGMEKCCCFIPLRLGTFIIALWFFVIYLLDAVTGFLGVNAVIVYSGQSAKAWYYIDLLFTVLVCLGGLLGIVGSCFASRGFAKFFSVIIWINCGLSIVKYAVSLALMVVHREDLIRSCLRSGFVGFSNAQTPISSTVTISESPYYAPVKYPGTLNAHATDLEQCQYNVQSFLIVYGVVIFAIEILQIYFASVVSAYASRLRNGARHHRLHDQQIKDFEESRYHMSTVY